MTNLQLFVVGVAVTVPSAIAIGGLIRAAILDGRENEQFQAEMAEDDSAAE